MAFLFAVLVLSPLVRAAEPPFQPGEKILYRVKQAGIKVGDATLEFQGEIYHEGQKYLLVVFHADGFNFYDEERIYLDPKTWRPRRVVRDLNIFGKKEKILEEYSEEEGVVHITKEVPGYSASVQTLGKGRPLENIYGFIYRYRLGEPLVKGQGLAMALPTVDIQMSALKETELSVGKKRYSAMLLKSVPDKYSIWFDQGPKRLPLRIAGAIGLANTVMTMVGVEEK